MRTKEELVKEDYQWQDLIDIVHCLRQPDGCPWDRVQTYESLKTCVTNEAQEVVEAVDNHDFINLKEELGDVLLQVLMYSEIAEERGEFTLNDVINEVSRKMVRRHPHVFGTGERAETPKEGLSKWNDVKFQEKIDRLKEYEEMYQAGMISKELLEKQQEKVRNLIKEKTET